MKDLVQRVCVRSRYLTSTLFWSLKTIRIPRSRHARSLTHCRIWFADDAFVVYPVHLLLIAVHWHVTTTVYSQSLVVFSTAVHPAHRHGTVYSRFNSSTAPDNNDQRAGMYVLYSTINTIYNNTSLFSLG